MIRLVLFLAAMAGGPPDPPGRPFAIRVVDGATGRGVPLIELRTVDAARFVTDNAGLVAFDEPGLTGSDVYFHVKGHGYEYPADRSGFRGRALRTTPGGEATLTVRRVNVAERLYRITGGGLYRDSLLLGRPVPLRNPAINGLVVGQDSVVNALRTDGTLLWFWGDTNRPSYPLGNFHVPGATSKLPSHGGLDPGVGVDLTYLVDGKASPGRRRSSPGTGRPGSSASPPGPRTVGIGSSGPTSRSATSWTSTSTARSSSTRPRASGSSAPPGPRAPRFTRPARRPASMTGRRSSPATSPTSDSPRPPPISTRPRTKVGPRSSPGARSIGPRSRSGETAGRCSAGSGGRRR